MLNTKDIEHSTAHIRRFLQGLHRLKLRNEGKKIIIIDFYNIILL